MLKSEQVQGEEEEEAADILSESQDLRNEQSDNDQNLEQRAEENVEAKPHENMDER